VDRAAAVALLTYNTSIDVYRLVAGCVGLPSGVCIGLILLTKRMEKIIITASVAGIPSVGRTAMHRAVF